MNKPNLPVLFVLAVTLVCCVWPSSAVARFYSRSSFKNATRLEDSCEEKTEFKCKTLNKCIKKYQVCDGHNDCDDKSDEISCECNNCSFILFSL